MRGMRVAQYALSAIAAVLLGYVALLAVRPTAHLPRPLERFGAPGDWPSIAVIVGGVLALCIVSYLVRSNRSSATVPLVIVVGLLGTAAVLGFATFAACRGQNNAPFFTALEWTVALIKGGTDTRSLVDGDHCPVHLPAALPIARFLVFVSFLVGVVGVATAAFRLQSDRIRVWWARSITAVVGVDDAAVSMVDAVARRVQSDWRGALVLMTEQPDGAAQQACRTRGARVLQVDFDRPETMGSKRFWRHVERIYLLSPDPSTNLTRCRKISKLLANAGVHQRLTLIVRIDDPWLAMAWRAEQLGGSDSRWIGDAVSKFEVTARRLLDQILAAEAIDQVVVCGSSPLTLALCADMTRRQLERDYHPLTTEHPLPKLVLVSERAHDDVADHRFQQEDRGFGTSKVEVEPVPSEVSESVLRQQVPKDGEHRAAAIFVDSITDPSTATRLAVRFRGMPFYAWDVDASVAAESVPIAGKLRNYRLGIDLPEGQAEDNFERAAMLTHQRFSSSARDDTDRYRPADPTLDPSLPWPELSDFYKGSNRDQVRHVLQIVEQLGGHTWNTWGDPQDDETVESLNSCADPRKRLALLGFDDEQAVTAMVRAEYERWERYLGEHGWEYGPKIDGHRDFDGRKHEKLVGWQETSRPGPLLDAAVGSLATNLIQLRELGYRSKAKWMPYRRKGEVTARRHLADWTWSAQAGKDIHAARGDWLVSDGPDHSWSVRHEVFETSYEHLGGDRWRARGVALARKAEPGELIETLDGPETALEGDWIVMGDGGEQWPTSAERFGTRYEGPVSFTERFEHWDALRQGIFRMSWYRRLRSYF